MRCVDSIVYIRSVYGLLLHLLAEFSLISVWLFPQDQINIGQPLQFTLSNLPIDYKENKKYQLVLCTYFITSFITPLFLSRPLKWIQRKTSSCRTRCPGSFLSIQEIFHRLNPELLYSSSVRKFVSSEFWLWRYQLFQRSERESTALQGTRELCIQCERESKQLPIQKLHPE